MAKRQGQIVHEGRLRFGAAPSTTVVAVTPRGRFKLFKILFGRDGSIYVPFPYLTTRRGLLAEVDPSTASDPKVLDLKKSGVVVEHDVKFSHHTSGVVLFSQSGKQDDLFPRRRSFPLTGPIGRVFEFHFYDLAGFKTLAATKEPSDDPITLRFDAHPSGLCVAAEWRTKEGILANTETATAPVGPHSEALRRSDGARLRFLFLGQPKGYPLQEHLLLLSVSEIQVAAGADRPTAIFFGGWDTHDGTPPATPKMLAFMYPYEGA